jgi:putative transcriptional regulator
MIQEEQYRSSLKGQFLIAMPSLADPNFHQTVTYLCEHTAEGAVGLVINRVHPELTMGALFRELDLKSVPEMDSLPIYVGGPVHAEEIFILHGPPFSWEGCRQVTPHVALSNSKDLLEMFAKGQGPESSILALGCAGWGPGQLESEIMANAWLNCSANDRVLFEIPVEKRWEEATKLMGIDPARLADSAGHA